MASLDVMEDPAVLVIATWTNEILLYSIKNLDSSSQPLKIVEDACAVSLLLQRAPLRLLAGLGNGMLITLDLAIDSGIKNMGRKASKLGSRPLRLFPISEWQGDERIAAVGLSERMSVIFETKGRIDFSSVGQRVSFRSAKADGRMSWPLRERESTMTRRWYLPRLRD